MQQVRLGGLVVLREIHELEHHSRVPVMLEAYHQQVVEPVQATARRKRHVAHLE